MTVRDLTEIAEVTSRPRTGAEGAGSKLSLELWVAFFRLGCETTRYRAFWLCCFPASTKSVRAPLPDLGIVPLMIHRADGEIHVRLITCGKCETIKQPIPFAR